MQLVIMVLTGLVDATDSNVGSGGYGFTVKPSILHHQRLLYLLQ
jgi:hypothetical protein